MNYRPLGIIEITGEHDSGKTLAALFANYEHGIPLNKIAFFHDDVKHPGFDKKDFGLFVDLVVETRGMRLFDYRQYVLDKINQIKPGQFQAIVFDTWTKFGESLRNYVISHRYEFRAKDEFIMQHDLKVVGAQSWKDAHNYEASMVGNIASLADCLIVTAHLKDDYKGGAKTGRQIDELGKAWDKVCNLRLWLRMNEDGGVPITLVLKRVHKPGIIKGKTTTIDVLPRRIKPLENEQSIWQAVNRYWLDPVSNRPLLEIEKPTEFELSILDGTLTQDQKEVWQAELREKQRQEKEEKELFNAEYQEVKAKVLELASSMPGPIPIKASKILAEIGGGWTQKDIVEMLAA